MNDTNARLKRRNAKADVCVNKVDMMTTLHNSDLRSSSELTAIIASQTPAAPAPQHKVKGIWNDETVARIKELVDKKLTAEAIASELLLTRSQILGICWRRGWQVGEKRPSHKHVPKQRTIGKRILKRGQSEVKVVFAVPDTRELRSDQSCRIARKASSRKPRQETVPMLPLLELAATPDPRLNTAGADFIRRYKKRTQAAIAPAEAVAASQPPAPEALSVPVVEIPPVPVVVIPTPTPEPARVVNQEAPVVAAEPVRDLSKCLTIFDLRDRHCRYPVSGTGVLMLYCSEPALDGKPYCSHCAEIAYDKPEKIDASKKPARRKLSAFSMRNGISFR